MKKPSRRQVLLAGAAVLATTHVLEATPEDLHETDHEGDGPFYRPGAPFRNNFVEKGISGIPFRLSGQVFDTTGKPLPGAVVDIWQANDSGDYDNKGWKLRGQIKADAQGRYDLKTIEPRWYKAGNATRAAHFHVKVHAKDHPELTTAIYFEGDPRAEKDSVIQTKLRMKTTGDDKGRSGKFDLVLRTA